MTLGKEKLVGHITVRIPMYAVSEQESWEIPEVYEYLRAGEAEIVEHDIPAEWYGDLHEDVTRDGLDLKNPSPQELTGSFSSDTKHMVERLIPEPMWGDTFDVEDVVLDDEESYLILTAETLNEVASLFDSGPPTEWSNGIWSLLFARITPIPERNYSRYDLIFNHVRTGRRYRASIHQALLPSVGAAVREFERPVEIELIQKAS